MRLSDSEESLARSVMCLEFGIGGGMGGGLADWTEATHAPPAVHARDRASNYSLGGCT